MTEKKKEKRKKHAKSSNKKRSHNRSKKTKTKDGRRTITQTVRININTGSKSKSKRRNKPRAPRQMRELSDIPQPIRKSNPIFHKPLAYDQVRGNTLNEVSRLLLTNSPQQTTADMVKAQLALDRFGSPSPGSPSPSPEEPTTAFGIPLDKIEAESSSSKAYKAKVLKANNPEAYQAYKREQMGIERKSSDDDDLTTSRALNFDEEKEDINLTPNKTKKTLTSRIKGAFTNGKKEKTKRKTETELLKQNAKSMKGKKAPNRGRKKPEKYSP